MPDEPRYYLYLEVEGAHPDLGIPTKVEGWWDGDEIVPSSRQATPTHSVGMSEILDIVDNLRSDGEFVTSLKAVYARHRGR